MEPIRITLDKDGPVRQLRLYKDGDEQLAGAYPSWIVFSKAKDYVVARVKFPFQNYHAMGVYKDQVFEWTDEFMYNCEIHTDIACQICAWCDEAAHEMDKLSEDEVMWREEDAKPLSVANAYHSSQEIREQLAARLYQTLKVSMYSGTGTNPPTTDEVARKASGEIISLLNGGQNGFPRMTLEVSQNQANVVLNKLAGKTRFRNGEIVELDTPGMQRHVHRFAEECAAEITRTAKRMENREDE